MGAFAEGMKNCGGGNGRTTEDDLSDMPFMSLLTNGKPAMPPASPPDPPQTLHHTDNSPASQEDSDNGNLTPTCPSVTSHDDFIMVDLVNLIIVPLTLPSFFYFYPFFKLHNFTFII